MKSSVPKVSIKVVQDHAAAFCVKIGKYQMDEKIKEWLEKTGYPLELFVHEKLVKRNYLCEKSSLYEDVESGIKREIDLAAYLSGPAYDTHSFSLQLLIECKKSEKPLIVLSEESKKERFKTIFGNERLSEYGLCNALAYAHLSDLSHQERRESIGRFSERIPVGYSVVPAFSKSDENIYKGIMGLAKANEYYRGRYIDFMDLVRKHQNTNHVVDNNPFQLQLPLLVVESPLFTASLNNKGDLSVVETDWASVNIRLPWDSDEDEKICSIQVIRKESFLNVIIEIEKYLNFISKYEVVGRAVKSPNEGSSWPQKALELFRSLLHGRT